MTTRDEWIEVTRIDHGKPVRESLRASAVVGVRVIDSGGTHGTVLLIDGGDPVLVAESLARMRALLGLGGGAAA